MGRRNSSYLTSIFALSIVLCFCSVAYGQTKERPKLKNFGASLEKLKWDSERKVAVQTKRKDARSPSSSDDVVRVETNLVVSDVLVLDPQGRPVQGLTQNDFLVAENGNRQSVGMFSLGDNAAVPRSIVLIIDYSCMEIPFLRTSVAAAKTLIDKLGPADRMAIVTDDVELLVNYTNNKMRLKDGLDLLLKRTTLIWSPLADTEERHIPFGRGFQYSALMAVLREAFNDEDVRPIIVFQTWGTEAHVLQNPIPLPPIPAGLTSKWKLEMDRNLKHFQEYMHRNRREFSLNEVYKAAETSRATIYTVVPGFRLIGLSSEEQTAQIRAANDRTLAVPWLSAKTRKLNRSLPREILKWEAEDTLNLQSALALLSTITGGWIEFVDQPSQADEIYSRIFSDINRRYLVGYYPTNKELDGKRRKVSISVREHPEYIVMGRKAYYASGPDQ
ncbi:MAG TPA: VWA domain-containing protein [Pyrinomonadaceae bacterium]